MTGVQTCALPISAVSGQKLVRPWLGGDFQNVSADIASALGMAKPEGVLVLNLNPLSPLAQAGLQTGDVIVAMDGKTLESAQELHYLLGLSRVGDQKLFEVRRNTENRNFTIQLVAAPETVPRDEQALGGQTAVAGLRVANLSPAMAEELGMAQDAQGVVITAVTGSAASKYLAKGDIIRSVNGAAIDSVQTLLKAVQQGGRGLALGIERGTQRLLLRLG